MAIYKDNQPVSFQFTISAQKGKENKSITYVVDEVSKERAKIRAEERSYELFPPSEGWRVSVT